MAHDLLRPRTRSPRPRRLRYTAVAAMAMLMAMLLRTEAAVPARAAVRSGGCVFVNGLQLTFTPGISLNPLLQSPNVQITGAATCVDLALLETVHFNMSVSGTFSCLGGLGSGTGVLTFDFTGSTPTLSVLAVAGPGVLHLHITATSPDVVVAEADLAWWPFDTIACLEGQTVTTTTTTGGIVFGEA